MITQRLLKAFTRIQLPAPRRIMDIPLLSLHDGNKISLVHIEVYLIPVPFFAKSEAELAARVEVQGRDESDGQKSSRLG